MNALEVKDLTKIYSNRIIGLSGINLEIASGDFFGLLGPNGAGKSTAIGIITGIVKKTSGTIKVFDHDVDLNSDQARSAIGVVPQELNIHVWEKVINVMVNQAGYYGVPRKIALERSEESLSRLGLWDKREELTKNLSGGMKRRLMIARALVHKPQLLILDEPSAGVDVELRRDMWEFLRVLNQQGVTIVLTTHYLEEAEYLCNKIAIIKAGLIVDSFNKRDLAAKLDQQSLILDLDTKVADIEKIDGFKLNPVEEYSLEVKLPRNKSVSDLVDIFNKKNIKVISVRSKTTRLEEFFLNSLK